MFGSSWFYIPYAKNTPVFHGQTSQKTPHGHQARHDSASQPSKPDCGCFNSLPSRGSRGEMARADGRYQWQIYGDLWWFNWRYPLVICDLLKMVVETVSCPIVNEWFSITILVCQRVRPMYELPGRSPGKHGPRRQVMLESFSWSMAINVRDQELWDDVSCCNICPRHSNAELPNLLGQLDFLWGLRYTCGTHHAGYVNHDVTPLWLENMPYLVTWIPASEQSEIILLLLQDPILSHAIFY